MAKLVVGADPFDMSALDLTDLADGTVVGSSATQIRVVGASFWFKINGTGFTTFDANGFPTDGTVTSFIVQVPGHAATNITSFSIATADFMGFVNTDNVSGLESALFSGNDNFVDGTGNDVLVGLGGNDSFAMTGGGNDTVSGGDGNDYINFAGTLTAADSVDGGAGSDKLILNGDYSAGVVFGAATVTNVETIVLKTGHAYNLTLNAATDTSSQSLLLTGVGLTASTDTMTIDASAVAGALHLVGGAGNDTLTGGAGTNVISGGPGDDVIYGGTGDNTIAGDAGYNQIIMSNWTAGDHVNGGSDPNNPGTLVFYGDFSAGVTIAGSQIVSIRDLYVQVGHSYNITLGAGGTLDFVSAAALGAGDTFTLDASAFDNTHGLTVYGGAGNATITGPDTVNAEYDLSRGGEDTVISAPGTYSTYYFDSAFDSGDVVEGGGGDTLVLTNTYADLVFNATNFTGIENLQIGQQNQTFATSYTTNDANVAAGQILHVTLGVSQSENVTTFDGAAETDGDFYLTAWADPELLFTGGAGDDTVVLTRNTTYNAGTQINGGAGNDTVEFINDGYLALTAAGLQNVENIYISWGNVRTVDANVAAGHTLYVTLNTGIFVGQAETDGNFVITGFGGAAIGGQGDDQIELSLNSAARSQTALLQGDGGADFLRFTAAPNTHGEFAYVAASDSTGPTYDTIDQFDPTVDFFKLFATVTGVDTSVTTGALSTATFNSDLTAAVGSAQLAAHHAVVFTPDSGTLAGDHFLIIDTNGTAGYQAWHDLVIQLTNATSLTLTTTDFTT